MFETIGVASRARELAMVMPRSHDWYAPAARYFGVGWGRGGGGAAELAAGAAARSAHGERAARWIETAGAVRDGWTVVE